MAEDEDAADIEGPRFGGLLRQRDFRLFWIGETVNQLGSAMALIGVPLLAVLFLHATTFEVGALAAAGYLPWLVIGLPAGAWVDRLPPRPVMIVCDVVCAALYASVPLAYAFGVLTVGQLLAVQLLAGAAAVVFGTAYQVNLPSLVKPDALAEANAKLQASTSAAALGGRGLSGVVAQVVGATAALVFNAASFLVSAACLLAIAAPEPRRTSHRELSTLRREVAAGMGFVRRDRYLRPLALFAGLANFALTALAALVVVFLVHAVGVAAGLTGVLTAVSGMGGLLAAFIARPIVTKIGSARGLLLAAVGALPFGLLIPITAAGPRLVFYAVGTLIAATGVTTSNIIIATFRQAYCPPSMLGRVTATMGFVTSGTSTIGALTGGTLGNWLGPRDALWVVLSVLAVSGAPLLSRAFTGQRDLPTSPRTVACDDASDQAVHVP
jgi:MFS family permease